MTCIWTNLSKRYPDLYHCNLFLSTIIDCSKEEGCERMERRGEVLKVGSKQTGVRREAVGKGKKESDRERRRKEAEERQEGGHHQWTCT